MKLLKDLGLRPSKVIRNGKMRNFRWGLYECPYCKNAFEYQSGRMKGSAPKSCGCLLGERHGDYKSNLYSIWKSIKQRCRLTSSTAYKYYGGKGVDICEEWYTSYTTFSTWALANGYKDNLSIDRIDPLGNYTPSNCRWVTRVIQARNTRKLRSTNTSGYRGVSWLTRDNRFYASISVNSTTINLGSFKTALEAAKAYDTYVVTNNLEHTINGVLHEPLQSAGPS